MHPAQWEENHLQTGDDQTLTPYIILMLGSLLGITCLVYRRKEMNK